MNRPSPALLLALSDYRKHPTNERAFALFQVLSRERIPVAFEAPFRTLIAQADSLARLLADNAEIAGLLDVCGCVVVDGYREMCRRCGDVAGDDSAEPELA